MPEYHVDYQANTSHDPRRASVGDESAQPARMRIRADSVIGAVMAAEEQFANMGLIPRVVAVEEVLAGPTLADMSDGALTETLVTRRGPYDEPMDPEEWSYDTVPLYQGDTTNYLSAARQVVDRLRDTALVPGLSLSMLGEVEGPIVDTMVEVRDEAAGHYRGRFTELKELTSDRQAVGWDGVLALARGIAARASELA